MSVTELRIARMQALELFAEMTLARAHEDDDLRPLAVVAEAWTMAGYHDGSLVDILPYQPLVRQARLELVREARKGRPRRILRADARGLLLAIDLAIGAGLFTGALASEAMRLRWVARRGHR